MKERNRSLDLLKCLCMLFVVIIHLMGHSGYLDALTKDTLVYYCGNYLLSLIHVAVPIFVLITGYFGLSFKLEKVITMEITLLFYSFLTIIIAFGFAGEGIEHTVTSILKTILPFSYKSWWFATHYIVLMFFAPYINTLLQSMDQKKHICLIVTCFILFNVISSFSLDPIDTTNGYSFINFIMLYIIGRYIRVYGLFRNVKSYQWFLGYCFFSLLILLSYRLYGNYKFATYNSVLLLFSAVSLFNTFVKIKIKTTIFSRMVPYTFAVYLISDSFYMRKIVNRQIIDFEKMADTCMSLIIMIFYAVAVMVCCMLIDYVWKRVFGKINKKIATVVCEKTYRIWNKVIAFLMS